LGGVRRRCPGQCLGVDILPYANQLAVPGCNGEDPFIFKRLVSGFHLARGDADDQHPVSLGDELTGFRRRLQRPGRGLEQIHEARVAPVRSGQRPILPWNDPLNVFGYKR